MDGLFSLFNSLVAKGILTSFSLQIILVLLFYVAWRYYLKPIKQMLQDSPKLSELKKSVDDIKAAVEDALAGDTAHFEENRKALEKVIAFVDNIGDSEKINTRELNEIRRDIEHVKQILNQFQGHMMYRGDGRRSGDFGNKELR